MPDKYAVCRLDPRAPIPAWILLGPFASITRTEDELSIVSPESNVPEGVQAERAWRRLKIEGPLDFTLAGVLASLAAPLADAGTSIFVVSTYDTDYLLVKQDMVTRALKLLTGAEHRIHRQVI